MPPPPLPFSPVHKAPTYSYYIRYCRVRRPCLWRHSGTWDMRYGTHNATMTSLLPALKHFMLKNVTEHKVCVLIFSTTFVWNISHCKKKWGRCVLKCILVFTQSTRYSSQILKNLEISRQIFDKYSNMKFHETRCSESRIFHASRKDGQAYRETWRSWEPFFVILRTRIKLYMTPHWKRTVFTFRYINDIRNQRQSHSR
jgi:hypothetical protein